MIRPGPDNSREPPFHQLRPEAFERLCTSLAAGHFVGVVNSDTYQTSGQKQFGVDFILDVENGGTIVGSCRADKDPSRERIVGAAEEFAEYWESKWKDENVDRFIFCSGAIATTDLRRKHIKTAREIVESLCVKFEVWLPGRLTELLSDRRSLVRRFFPFYEEVICADNFTQPASLRRNGAAIDNVRTWTDRLEAELSAAQSSLDQLVQNSIANAERKSKLGVFSAMRSVANDYINNDQAWLSLTLETQARLLRVHAIGYLNDDDPQRAQSAFRESLEYGLPKDRYLEAIILHRLDGAQAALQLLNENLTFKERTLKAAIALSDGQSQLADDLLEEVLPSSPDFKRLIKMTEQMFYEFALYYVWLKGCRMRLWMLRHKRTNSITRVG